MEAHQTRTVLRIAPLKLPPPPELPPKFFQRHGLVALTVWRRGEPCVPGLGVGRSSPQTGHKNNLRITRISIAGYPLPYLLPAKYCRVLQETYVDHGDGVLYKGGHLL